MTKRQLLLTVYKSMCIFPLENLEEHHDQTEIQTFAGPFAGDARPAHLALKPMRGWGMASSLDRDRANPAGILNGGTLCFAN
jgi:hypothetical protein